MPLLCLSRERPKSLIAVRVCVCDWQLSLAQGLQQGDFTQPPPGRRSLCQYISACVSFLSKWWHLQTAQPSALTPFSGFSLRACSRSDSTARAPCDLGATLWSLLTKAKGCVWLKEIRASAQAAKTLQGSLQFHYTVRRWYHLFFF